MQGALICENCEMKGRHAKAVKEYISIFTGEKTRVCAYCYADAIAIKDAIRVGPYTNQTESGIGPCADRIRDKAARSYRKVGSSSDAGAAAALSSPQTCAAILGQLLIEPLTPDEVSRITGKVLNTVRARITNMKDFGYVRDTGKTRLATDAGKAATIWTITDAGREWLSQWRAAA